MPRPRTSPRVIIKAIEAVTFEDVAESLGTHSFGFDSMAAAFVAAVKKHEGAAEPRLEYLRLYGQVFRRFMDVMGAGPASIQKAEQIRRTLQEYNGLSVPREAKKLHRLAGEMMQISLDMITVYLDKHDMKTVEAKGKQFQRLNDEASKEWDRLAGQR